MQVRVLRLDPAGSSANGWVEEEKDGARRVVGVVAEAESALLAMPKAAEAGAILIVRSEMGGDAPGWMPASRARFEPIAGALESAGEIFGVELCIWPTALGAVSDVPSTLSFMEAAVGRERHWRLLFDPVSMLTPAMLPRAEDHIERLFESLSGHKATWAALLADADERAGCLVLAPLQPLGALTTLIVEAWKRWKPATPIILLNKDLSQQTALL